MYRKTYETQNSLLFMCFNFTFDRNNKTLSYLSNICEGASERRNENIIVSGTLKKIDWDIQQNTWVLNKK